MSRITLLVCLIVLLSAMPVGAQYYTNYPTLDEPTHYLESYYPEVRLREDQTQAAFLLILLNLVSSRDHRVGLPMRRVRKHRHRLFF
jgi:hypothetical protein